MKTGIHPDNYRLVVFEDTSNGFKFLTKSTAATKETTKWEDGKEYPLVQVHISSASHPFYTGEEKIVDVEGRVDRFKARAEAAEKQRGALSAKAKKRAKRATEKPEPTVQKIGAKPSTQNKPKPQDSKPTEAKPADPAKPDDK